MPVSITLFEKDHVVASHFQNVVTFDEFSTQYDGFCDTILTWPEVTQICDYSAVQRLDISIDQMRDLAVRKADCLGQFGRTARMLIIAPRDALFGLARVYGTQASFGGAESVVVARDASDAADMIGMTAQTIEAYVATPPLHERKNWAELASNSCG